MVFIGTSALTDIVSTVTDNGGNIYTKAYGVASGTGGDTELWYSINSQSTTSVVVTFSAGITTKSVFVREYSNIAMYAKAFDQQITASGSGTGPTTGNSSNTSDDVELVVCSCSCLGTSPTLSVGLGYGNFVSQTVIAAASIHAISDKQVAARAIYAGGMTAGGTLPVWDIGMATFVINNFNNPGNEYRYIRVGNGMSRNEVAS